MAQLTVADKMRMARARAQLSLDQMAHSISTITGDTISRETVRRYEKGSASPDVATLEAVAEISGLSYGWLVGVSLVCADPGYLNLDEDNLFDIRDISKTSDEMARDTFRTRRPSWFSMAMEEKPATVVHTPRLFDDTVVDIGDADAVDRWFDLLVERQSA